MTIIKIYINSCWFRMFCVLICYYVHHYVYLMYCMCVCIIHYYITLYLWHVHIYDEHQIQTRHCLNFTSYSNKFYWSRYWILALYKYIIIIIIIITWMWEFTMLLNWRRKCDTTINGKVVKSKRLSTKY